MDRAYGVDISSWQDDNNTPKQIDFLKMKQKGVSFIFIRATYGNWSDPDFEYNWSESKKVGLIRGAYHLHRFGQSPIPQMNRFTGMLKNDPGELPPTFDVERKGFDGKDRDTILSVSQLCVQHIETNCKRPLIYSNPDTILNFLHPVPAWMLGYDLWIANYGIDEPRINGWKTWKFWQYTDKGDGLAHGAESKQIDCDWFNGTLAELHKYAGLLPPGPTVEERLSAIETWARSKGFGA